MRLRFSIRDLLWLTALVAVLVAWWLDHRSLRREAATEYNALRHYFIHVRPHAFVRVDTSGAMPADFQFLKVPDIPPEKVVP